MCEKMFVSHVLYVQVSTTLRHVPLYKNDDAFKNSETNTMCVNCWFFSI